MPTKEIRLHINVLGPSTTELMAQVSRDRFSSVSADEELPNSAKREKWLMVLLKLSRQQSRSCRVLSRPVSNFLLALASSRTVNVYKQLSMSSHAPTSLKVRKQFLSSYNQWCCLQREFDTAGEPCGRTRPQRDGSGR